MKIILGMLLVLFSSPAVAFEYPDLDIYYPLASGNKWVYDVQIGLREDKIEVYNSENGIYIISAKSVIGKTYYSVRKVGDRIEQVAHFNIITGEVVQDVNRKIMVAPFKKGLKWTNIEDGGYSTDFTFLGYTELQTKVGRFKKVAKFKIVHHSPKDKAATTMEYYAPNVGLVKSEFVTKKKVEPMIELVDYHIEPVGETTEKTPSK